MLLALVLNGINGNKKGTSVSVFGAMERIFPAVPSVGTGRSHRIDNPLVVLCQFAFDTTTASI